MQTAQLDRALSQWPEFNDILFVPRTPEEYEKLVGFLDQIIDEVGENETHPLASLAEILGVLIERYEDEHVPEIQ